MSYAYGMRGAPAVGNGLGGLPRRVSETGSVGDIRLSAEPPKQGSWVSTEEPWSPSLLDMVSGPICKGQHFAGSGSNATAAAFSPDSLSLVVAFETVNRVYRRSEAGAFSPITLPTGLTSANKAVAFSPSGDILVSIPAASHNTNIVVHKIVDDSFIYDGYQSTESMNATSIYLSFSPDGQYLALVANTLRIYKREGFKFTLLTIPSSRTSGGSPAWSPDGQYLVFPTLYSVGGFQIYKRGSGDTFTLIPNIQDPLPLKNSTSCAFSPDGKLLAVGKSLPNAEEGLIIYEHSDGVFTKIAEPAHVGSTNNLMVEFSSDGEFLITSAFSQGNLVSRRVRDGFKVATDERGPMSTGARDISVSPDGMFIIACSTSASLQRRVLAEIQTLPPLKPWIRVA